MKVMKKYEKNPNIFTEGGGVLEYMKHKISA
jgi:hypothetical protein